ncbi:uncharacterized protein LOC125034090 [Penaeus chinensis]|uniref:uncharacterized protein LOC125034090 n=1 Tax=Penaeus chinensis TaxID=139456 RepID=UPI001FB847E6|nr:uncharacterized protein LOC125034090 [Penaeus chinensis]
MATWSPRSASCAISRAGPPTRPRVGAGRSLAQAGLLAAQSPPRAATLSPCPRARRLPPSLRFVLASAHLAPERSCSSPPAFPPPTQPPFLAPHGPVARPSGSSPSLSWRALRPAPCAKVPTLRSHTPTKHTHIKRIPLEPAYILHMRYHTTDIFRPQAIAKRPVCAPLNPDLNTIIYPHAQESTHSGRLSDTDRPGRDQQDNSFLQLTNYGLNISSAASLGYFQVPPIL